MTCNGAPVGLATESGRTTEFADTGDLGAFEIELFDRWLSPMARHGGSFTAIAVSAAGRAVHDRSVRMPTTSFLRSGQPGPADVEGRELLSGRSITALLGGPTQASPSVTTTRLAHAAHPLGRAAPARRGVPDPVDGGGASST